MIYENICRSCNKGAGEKKEPKELRADVPSLYVGETSRSLYERSREHWKQWESKDERSHILKHMEMVHNKGEEKPDFVMRAVAFHRSALTRQVGEAVRIGRRGGAGMILNSKSEYDRCRIPRLVLEEQEEDKLEEQELETTKKNLEEQAKKWSTEKYNEKREQDLRSWRLNGDNPGSTMRNKREQDFQDGTRRKKRRKYKLMEQDWGTREQGDLYTEEQEEQGAIYCSPEEPELPPNPEVREQEKAFKELKQTRITTFMPVAPPKASSPSTPNKLQERDQERVGTERCEQYSIDNQVLCRDRGKYFGKNSEDDADRGGGLSDNNYREGKNIMINEDVPENLQYKETLENEGETTPSVNQAEEKAVVCVGSKSGRCETHDCEGQFLKISSKKWRDRGKGRGFGYVHVKVRRFICGFMKSNPSAPRVNPEGRFRDEPARNVAADNSSLKGKSKHVD